jgi:hypothetical protein
VNNAAPAQVQAQTGQAPAAAAAAPAKASTAEQWNQCKSKTMAVSQNLFWKVVITEGIPLGGTYAKGSLEGNSQQPVRVIIKSDSQLLDKIKTMLAPGKTAFLRGNCTGLTDDGAVILQAF